MKTHETHPVLAATFLILVFAGAGLLGEMAVRSSRTAAKTRADQAYAGQVLSAVKLGRQGKVDEALSLLEALVAERPENTDARFNFAVALAHLGRRAEARAQFEKVVSIDPRDFDAVVELAAIDVRDGKLDDALTLLESVPLGAAHFAEGALRQARWDPLRDQERMKKLVAKHKGVEE